MRVIDLATLLLAAIAAVVELAGPVWANWITRPLVNLLLLLVAAAGTRGAYRTLILIGLASAAIGDLLPLISGGLFFVSLVVFLTVHLCYIAAFWPGVGLHGAWIARLVYVTLGVAMVAALWPVLPPLQRVAIAVYAALIVTMAGQAAGRWSVLRTPGARSAGLGAGLFLISDGILALDRWRADFYGAGLVVLLTYYVAQWLIARSTSDTLPEQQV
jgi:uncharacterized membrane protein YhhN